MNRLLRWTLALVMVALISEPALPQEQSASTEKKSSISIRSERGVERWRTSTILSDFNIELRGRIEVTDDDKDIKSISDDGYLEINKTVFGSRRTILIESLGGGKMKKEYYEGRTKMDWEKSGKEWLGEILPEIVRSTTLGAEGRVNRYFRQGSAAAVVDEIQRLEGDYTQAHYAKLLLEKNIQPSEMANVINKIAETIDSDYYLSTVLQNNISKLLATPGSADAFFRATRKIDSDYYRSVVLKEGLKKNAASPEQVKLILQSASDISSSYYLSVVLTTLLEESETKEESLTELINVSKNIESDYYRTEVLMKAIKKQGLSKAAVKSAINAVADVSSDYYKTNVFNSMAEHSTMEPEMVSQVVNILDNSVGSDYYASVTMTNILKHQKLSDDAFRQLVTAAGNLGSTAYAAEVLKEAAAMNLSRTQLIDVIKAAEHIDSDHYLTSVLSELAPKVKTSDSAVKDAYRQAAKHIDSESYYGKALRQID